MKSYFVVNRLLAIAITLGFLPSMVLSAEVVYSRARVIACEPIVRNVYVSRPVEYRDEYVTVKNEPSRKSATSSLVGGVVGGLLGNQVGKGNGKVVATVAGAVLGASVGHDISQDQGRGRPVVQRRYRVEERGYTEERIEGYRVTYEYNGNTYTTNSIARPGAYIDVRVETTVSPVLNGYKY